jgi:hypothetical protein
MSKYGHNIPFSDEERKVIDLCDALPKVKPAAMKSLWSERWTCDYAEEDDVTHQSQPFESQPGPVTLTNMTARRVVDEALQMESRDTWIEQATQLSDFSATMRERLRMDPSSLPPSSRAAILGIAFRDCEVVNLVPFDNLEIDELVSILHDLSKHHDTSLQSITLPDINNLTLESLQTIFSIANIRQLHLGRHAASVTS